MVDEMHRAGAKTWKKGLQKMFEVFPKDCKYVGFSATPIRFLDGKRNMAEELFDGSIANEIGLSDAILNRILPLPRYIAGLYSYDSDFNAINRKIMQSCNSEEEKKEFLEEVKVLKNNLDKSSGISDIFKKYVDNNKGKYVAFCRNITHLKLMKPCLEKWFSEAGIKVNLYEVHCKNQKKDKEFQAFMDDDGLSVCLSVGMMSEGVHEIDGVILLRDTISPNLYYQQLGRCFSVDMKTVPIIFDLVANCESIMDCNLKNDLLAAIEKRDIEDRGKDGENEKEKDEGGNRKDDKNRITKEDIEKFFVFDQVLDSVSAFRDIEGRLKNSWDLYIKALEEFKEKNGSCLVPFYYVHVFEDGTRVKLGNWVSYIRQVKKGNCKRYILTHSKLKQLNELNFSWETENMFDKFYRYALIYKERYGHVDIKVEDKLNGYSIGKIRKELCFNYKNGKLSNEQVEKLMSIGINITLGKHERKFQQKMNLARQAVDEGIVITNKNHIYNGVDLYQWYFNKKDKFTKEELEIMNKLISNVYKKSVAIINVKNGDVHIYPSILEASRALKYDFHVSNTEKGAMTAIHNRLSGHTKNPIYKNQFRFEYAD